MRFIIGGLCLGMATFMGWLSYPQQQSVAPQQSGQQQMESGQNTAVQNARSARSHLIKVDLKPALLTLADGRKGWKVTLPGKRPLATPAYANRVLYVGGGFGSFEFYAFEARRGKTRWAMRAKDDGPTGAVIQDDRVIFNTESCVLICADAKSGKVVWERWMGDPLMSQPAADKDRVYMVYPGKKHQHYLACLNLKDGKTIWERPVSGEAISAPIVNGSLVHLATLDGTLYEFTIGGKQQYAKKVNATSAPTFWQGELFVARRQDVKSAHSSKSVVNENISGMSIKGGQTSERSLTGKEAAYLTQEYQQENAAAQKAQDTQVGFSNAPAAAKISQAQSNLGISTVSGVWAYQGSRPLLNEGQSYQTMHDELRCVDARTGKSVWSYKYTAKKSGFAGRTMTPPVIVNGKAFVGTSDGLILCLNAKTGKKIWSASMGEPISAQPIVANGWVYGTTDRGTVFGFPTNDARDGGWHMWGANARHNGLPSR